MTPVPTIINEKWELLLPPHRAERQEWWKRWEVERLASMHSRLSPGDLIVDIGAEEGDMPALYASWGCGVYAIEPNPDVWPNIRACFEANDFSLRGWFVGFAADSTEYEPRHAPLNMFKDQDGWPKCAYGNVITDHGFRNLSERIHDTPRATLDDLMARDGLIPNALTLDVEGSELRVMRGASHILREYRPLVWCSVHPKIMADLYDDNDQTLHDYMASFGYQAELIADIHEQHWLYEPQ
ncbi:MAG TPA: FkbM family methyltransferase [Candidatus Tectomicrobia bacterium]